MENGERRSVPMVLVLVRGSRMADSFWYIKNCNLFSQLSAADISELESQSRMRKLKRGEAVYLPQDQADGVILVAQGRVKICHATPDGKQSILGFHLPYMDVRIDVGDSHKKNKGQWIGYRSVRSHPGELPAKFKIDYRPIGKSFQANAGSLEEFLTARYCLYSADKQGKIFRGEIDHEPWHLQEAQAIIHENTMTDWMGVQLPNETPLLHFAKHTKVIAWTLEEA